MRGQMHPEWDETAVSIVVTERVSMKLTGADRKEAVRRLDALGVPGRQTLDLLQWYADDTGVLTRYRKRHGLPRPLHLTEGLSRTALGLEKPENTKRWREMRRQRIKNARSA